MPQQALASGQQRTDVAPKRVPWRSRFRRRLARTVNNSLLKRSGKLWRAGQRVKNSACAVYFLAERSLPKSNNGSVTSTTNNAQRARESLVLVLFNHNDFVTAR